MNKQDIDALIIDYLSKALSHEEMLEVEKMISESGDIQNRYTELEALLRGLDGIGVNKPSGKLKENFYNYLDEILQLENEDNPEAAQNQKRGARRIPIVWQSAAAVGLILIGIFIGTKWNQQRVELQAIRMEMSQTKDMMSDMLNQNSTSGRIKAVHATYNIAQPDDEIVAVLLKTLTTDPSENVRLAALDALLRFADYGSVAAELAQALEEQNQPAVQIALINGLVELKVREAAPALEDLIADDDIQDKVKDEARMGLFKIM